MKFMMYFINLLLPRGGFRTQYLEANPVDISLHSD